MSTVVEIKLASIVVHVQELLSPDGREADRQALLPLIRDPEIIAWLKKFDEALLPVKRRPCRAGDREAADMANFAFMIADNAEHEKT